MSDVTSDSTKKLRDVILSMFKRAETHQYDTCLQSENINTLFTIAHYHYQLFTVMLIALYSYFNYYYNNKPNLPFTTFNHLTLDQSFIKTVTRTGSERRWDVIMIYRLC